MSLPLPEFDDDSTAAPWTVSELTEQLKSVIEQQFRQVVVVGELSNCTRASSGHVYLTLKDDEAQLRGVIWRMAARGIRFELEDGLMVVATGKIELYPARGQYQLMITRLEPVGIGGLELAFRQLQEKLAAEGLFDPDRKRPLPRFPRRIAIITSPTGAAIRDMLQVLTRRWPGVDVVLLPVAVQGAEAAGQIAAALRKVGQIPGVDVVITGRGGGSLEDLWAFNEEVVARAIHACPLPVVSAVGHEVDVTIADLVADRRALTPSEAAELVVPSFAEVATGLQHLQQRLATGLQLRAKQAQSRLESLANRPAFRSPHSMLNDRRQRLERISERLVRATQSCVADGQRAVGELAASLQALSPLSVLQRGYSLTKRATTGELLRAANGVQVGDRLDTLLGSGRIISVVESVDLDDDLDEGE